MQKKLPPKPKSLPHRRKVLPDEKELLAFMANSPGNVGKREVARAFGLKGQDKIGLKMQLKQLMQKGVLSRQKNKLKTPATLGPVTVIEMLGIDADGEAYGKPAEWDEQTLGAPPLVHLIAKGQQAPGVADRVLAKITASLPGSAYAYASTVIRPISREALRIVGIFRENTGKGARIIPSGKKERDDYIVAKGDEAGARDGELVAAEIISARGRGLPQARVRARLGSSADPRNTSLIAIHTHGIPDQFPAAVMEDAEALQSFKLTAREDLRHLPLITIDPADARDHDDAIWATPDDDTTNPGGHKLIIAIADVATYVTAGSALDREARKRGNSVYFPDRVVPMLPERISNDLCSLKEAEDRPAIACCMTIDANGQKRAHHFSRITMRVAAGLSYEEAQAAINGAPSLRATKVLKTALQPLWNAYRSLCIARDKRGPLDLDLPERKVLLDPQGNVERVISPARLDAHRLVEEFMIQANVAAAEQLNKKRTPQLFRVHEEPSAEKLRSLSEFLKTVNIPLALGQVMRAKHFNRILHAAKDTTHQRIVNEVVLRSQAQANYQPVNAGHFGLSLANYAHFTSPIRRYADLIVHRALITAQGFGNDGLSSQDIANLQETADQISATERRAMLAERETTDRLVAAHLSGKLGATFAGRISGVVSAGLFVNLKETGADGFVPVSSLGHDYFTFDVVRHALVGSTTGETFQLGDTLDVRLLEATPVKGGLRFEVVTPGKAGEKPKRSQQRFRTHKPKSGKPKRRG